MSNFRKKDKQNDDCCTCESCGAVTKIQNPDDLFIAVLGGGCAKCNQLEEAVKAALHICKVDKTVEHIKDYAKIASYGVMTTPALVINDKVVVSGRVPKVGEIVKWLEEAGSSK